jgi:Uma2 family endonuclease
MSILAHQVRYTYAEYVLLEKYSNVKHEFWDGQMYAMAGGTLEHGVISGNAFASLHAQLRARCRVVGSDVRILTATGLATYPDTTVICGEARHDSQDRLAIINPTLIVEVLSPSTEHYDRGEKFEHYNSLESLRQYVLISHREHSVEVWTRGDDNRWSSAIVHDGEVAELAIGARLDVRELYETAAEPTA